MSVILRGGSMSKARFNGIEATILTLENGAGGWATVCVDGEVVKWRSNSWDWIGGVPVILSIPVEIMGCILSHVKLIDVITCMKTAKIFRNAFTIPTTWADADFLCIRQGKMLDFACFLIEVGASIRRLRVHVGHCENGILGALISSCGAILEEVDFRILRWPNMLRLPAVVDSVIDVDAPQFLLPLPPVLNESGSFSALCSALEGCHAIRTLSLGTQKDGATSRAPAPWPRHPRLSSVRKLECYFPLARSVHAAIAELPELEHLILRVDIDESVELEHPNLRIVDMRGSSKRSKIGRLACPKLEQVMCGRLFDYGSGICMVNPYTRELYLAYTTMPEDRHHRGFEPLCVGFAPHTQNLEMNFDEGDLLNIPARCEISWTHPPIFACLTTPMIELHDELDLREHFLQLRGRQQLPLRMVKHFYQEALAHLQSHRAYNGGLLAVGDNRRDPEDDPDEYLSG